MDQPTQKAPGKPKRRRCDNCFKLYERTKDWQRFCSKSCRFEFNRHGAAFGPLKTRLEKLVLKTIEHEVKTLRAEITELRTVLHDLLPADGQHRQA